jgi:hypothetical protein
MKTKTLVLALSSAAFLWCGPSATSLSAQTAVPPPATVYQPLSDQQLDQLLGPVALYPDPLLAAILPAATLPTEIVLADRYLAGGGDIGQIGLQPLDPSVQALAHYPAVLQYLDNNLNWTIAVGQAFLYQQQEVMESIQRLRLSARNFGNLQSTPQQQVVDDNGEIEILPAEPDVIYVPIYQPDIVYFQSGCALSFGFGCSIGPWLNCDFDWLHHNVCFWGPQHRRPTNWWHATANQRAAWLARQTTVWQPGNHPGYNPANRGGRGWNNQVAHTAQPQPQYNSIVKQSHPAAVPRPSATPRSAAAPAPAAIRESGAFPLPKGPAPAVDSADHGAFVGGDSSRDARNFSERGQQSMDTAPRPAPAYSEPVRSEPVHSEPAYSEPAHSEPPVSHSEPPANSGGGSAGSSRH